VRFAPEGRWFIVGAWLIVAALAAARLWIPLVFAALLALWVMWFFRDPERRWARGDDLILAPADGKVVSIVEADEPAFIGALAIRISIFMNVFDCHVNRYPVNGAVEYRYYNPRRFLNATTNSRRSGSPPAAAACSSARLPASSHVASSPTTPSGPT
jgi:phosphatidylserine decarboxylase